MSTACPELETTEIFPAVESGVIRLTAAGLWLGEGTYTSPIVDLGNSEILFSGVYFDSIEPTGTDIKIECRWHRFIPPVTNSNNTTWQDGDLPNSSDPVWGTNPTYSGFLPVWTEYSNAIMEPGQFVRYIQWRAILTAS